MQCTNNRSRRCITAQLVDKNKFDILASRSRIIWIRSKTSGDEFVITSYSPAPHPKNFGYAWHVMHRHAWEDECHYHANEKTFENAIRHIVAHDRGASRRI